MSFGSSALGSSAFGAGRVLAPPVAFSRPAKEVLASGWAAIDLPLAPQIGEQVAQDGTFIISPRLDAAPGPGRFMLDAILPAGSHVLRVRPRRLASGGEFRIVLLNPADSPVGSSAWLAAGDEWVTHVVAITSEEAAAKFQIEVRA